MLYIKVPANEFFDSKTQTFINIKETNIALEHSLVSISKWEAKWHKPFISKTQKTRDEVIDYIKEMTITQNVDPAIYYGITEDNIKKVNDYIANPMTATWFPEDRNSTSHTNSEQITSELIYYWMVSYQIPFECQKWHLNRLLTLIRICNVKNKPAKKMSKKDILSRNAALNAKRKAAHGTRG